MKEPNERPCISHFWLLSQAWCLPPARLKPQNLLVNPGFESLAGTPLTAQPLRLAGLIFRRRSRQVILVIIGSRPALPTVSPRIRVLIIGVSGAPLTMATPMWRAYTKPLAAVPDRSIRPAGGSPRRAATMADWARMPLLGFKSSFSMRTAIFSPFTSRVITPPAWGLTLGFNIR